MHSGTDSDINLLPCVSMTFLAGRTLKTNDVIFLSLLFGFHTMQLWLGKIPQNGRMRKDKQGRVAVEKEC